MSGQSFPFPLRFRRSSRAKRLRVVVRPEGVECVLPGGCSTRFAEEFIGKHRAWLTRKFAEASARTQVSSFWREAAGGCEVSFPLHGVEHPFSLGPSAARRPRLDFDGTVFRLLAVTSSFDDRLRMTEQAVYAWSRTRLAECLAPLIRRYACELGVDPRHVRIKRMRTRWGSCGAKNDINLNWLLIAVPPSVLEYVLVHELCHIRHRDHSERFWRLVEAHYPDFRAARNWLKASGSGLMHRFEARR